MNKNKSHRKQYAITGIIIVLTLLISTLYFLYYSHQNNSDKYIKVYKDLTSEDETILYQNIKALRQAQLYSFKTNSKNSVNSDQHIEDTDSIVDVEKPIIKPDNKSGNINESQKANRLMAEAELENIPKPTKIVDLGNGIIFDPSKTIEVTPEMLGVTPIIITNIEDARKMYLEIESYNMSELQPLLDLYRPIENSDGSSSSSD